MNRRPFDRASARVFVTPKPPLAPVLLSAAVPLTTRDASLPIARRGGSSTSGSLAGASASLHDLPAGRYTLVERVGVPWPNLQLVTNANDVVAQTMRNTDAGTLPVRNVSAVTSKRGWTNFTGYDVMVTLTLDLSAPAPLALVLRYLARGTNSAMQEVTAGVARPLALGEAILAGFALPGEVRSLAPTGFRTGPTLLAGAQLTITGPTATDPAPVDPAPVAPAPVAPAPVAPALGTDRATVSHYQAILYNLGHLAAASDVDGLLGAKTTAATRLFQQNYNAEQQRLGYRFQPRQLTVNGTLGAATRQALENYRGVLLPGSPAPVAPVAPVAPAPVRPSTPAAPPAAHPPASTLEVRPPATAPRAPEPDVRNPAQPTAQGTPQQPAVEGMPWGKIILASVVVAAGYTAYKYRHEIRGTVQTQAPVVRARVGEYAASAGAAAKRGSKSAARRAGASLSRYGNA